MKFLVCVKQVLLLDNAIAFSSDERQVDSRFLHAEVNEGDLFALEEALRLREVLGGEVVATTYGPLEADAVLRRALAMGVDRAVRVEGVPADPYAVGEGLAQVARQLQPDLILCGVQSTDSAHAATGAVIAGLLDLPCAAVITSLQVEARRGRLVAIRELGGGVSDRLHVLLPAVVAVQTGINQPRHPNLRAIKLAERASIELVGSVGIEAAYRIRSLFLPISTAQTQPLGEDIHEAAASLARIIREHVR